MIDINLLYAVAAMALFAMLFLWPIGMEFSAAGIGGPPEREKPERKPWEDLLMFNVFGSTKVGKPPEPDPAIGEAALRNAALGEQWLKFAQEQFAAGDERQAEIDDLTKRVTESQLGAQDQSNRWAQEDRSRWESLFQPIEDRFVEDAQSWDSPERQAQRAAEARADVQSSAQAQRSQAQREAASMGVNPNSGRFQGQERAGDLQTALASAGAQNAARNQVRSEGMALRGEAANMGRGLPSQAAGAMGLGINAGNAATGNTLAGQSSWQANNQIMGQGYSGAMQGAANQGNMLGNLYGNQLGAWQARQGASSNNMASLMGLGGAALGAAGQIWGNPGS